MGQRGHVIHRPVMNRVVVVGGEQRTDRGKKLSQLAAAKRSQLAAANHNKSSAKCKKRSRQLAAAKNRTKLSRQHRQLAATNKSAKSIDTDLLLGDVTETDQQHLARHACGSSTFQNCLRCVAIRRREEIAQVAPWAVERPRHLGGAWRLGCRICAAGRLERDVQSRRRVHMHRNAGTNVCRQSISRCSVWAKFQYAGPSWSRRSWGLLRMRFAEHASSDFHRISADVFKSPSYMLKLAPVAIGGSLASSTRQAMDAQLDAVEKVSFNEGQPAALGGGQPAALGGQPAAPPGGQLAAPGQPVAPRQPAVNLDLGIGSVHDPFRGNVPQREEWLEVWADSTSTIGFRKQDAVNEKRCLSQMERRKRCKMVAVMACVVRNGTRKRLREATSVSVAVDECDTRKVIRVRCDTPEPPHQWDGVLGIIRKRYGLRAYTEHTTLPSAAGRLPLCTTCEPFSNKCKPIMQAQKIF